MTLFVFIAKCLFAYAQYKSGFAYKKCVKLQE